jgi:transglutaminase-like putative cysteine protease
VRELKIEVDLVADMSVYNPFDFFVEESAENWPFEYPEDLAPDLVIYRQAGAGRAAAEGVPGHHPARACTRTVDFVVYLNARIANEIGYVIRMEPGVQTPEETFEAGTASCRDSTWLLVQAAAPPGLRRALRVGLL